MNKAELTVKARAILGKHIAGDVISCEHDRNFLLQLFTQHEHYDQKQGCGIDEVFVMRALYGSKCFGIKRLDGSVTDISYISCIKGKTNKLENVKKACRSAVDMEVAEVRLSVSPSDRCPFTGELLLPDNLHIDHYDLTFSGVFNTWLKGKDIETLYLATNYTAVDLSFRTFFLDEEIAEDFRKFHNANTHLRAVSKRANLVLLK